VKDTSTFISDLSEFIKTNPELFVITGAGVSHGSGIPTYRDDIGNWKGNSPIQHADFVKKESSRKRYWARSFSGWPNVSSAKPNSAHLALADIESMGYLKALVTQNVDRLHQKAGHQNVIDLHGRLDQVICMDCGNLICREELQEWLCKKNPHMLEKEDTRLAFGPDGDAEVRDEIIQRMKVPSCSSCFGLLKPNVVFYGSTVKKEIVYHLSDLLLEAKALLVIGTSLMVYSSFRFCKQANENCIPIACINQGATRADKLFSLKVDGDCSEVLSELRNSLIS